MYSQLGSIVFVGAKTFTSFSGSSDESYARQERIGGKPIVQHTGTGLEQVSLSIRFHVSFCNPAEELKRLTDAKESGEVLPYVLGNGVYRNDYVITGLSEAHEFVDKDGTVLSCVVNITLLEFVSEDKLHQAKMSARKAAFAVGDRKMVTTPRIQPPSEAQQCAVMIGDVSQQAAQVSNNVGQYENNINGRPMLASRIQVALSKMEKSIGKINAYANDARRAAQYSNVVSASTTIRVVIRRFQFPIRDVDELLNNSRELEAVLRLFKGAVGQLLNDVATRRL